MPKVKLSEKELSELANLDLSSVDDVAKWLCDFYDRHDLNKSLKKAESVLSSTHPIMTAIELKRETRGK